MRLYVGPSTLFIQDTQNHQIRLRLRNAFFAYNGSRCRMAWHDRMAELALRVRGRQLVLRRG